MVRSNPIYVHLANIPTVLEGLAAPAMYPIG